MHTSNYEEGWVFTLWTMAILLVIIVAIYVVYYVLHCGEKRPRYTWPVTFRFHHFTIKGTIMQVQLMAGYELPFVLGKPINKDGGEAPIQEGSLQKISSDESCFTVERDDQAQNPDDPYTGKLVWRGAGDADFNVSADADLGDGVEEIAMTIVIECLPEGAIGFAPIQFGPPRKIQEESPSVGE